MRFSLALPALYWFTLCSIGLTACAKEHSARDLIDRGGPRSDDDFVTDEDEIEIDDDWLDAGPHRPRDVGFDAGRRDAGSFGPLADARVPDGGAPRDASGADGSSPSDGGSRDAALDANLAPWQSPDAATVSVGLVAACEAPQDAAIDASADAAAVDAASDASADPTSDASTAACRPGGWHTPPCYRAPNECPALHESVYCTGFSADGNLLFVGLERGARCSVALGHDSRYPSGPGSNAFALIGPDVYSVFRDVIVKRSLTDGSFDVAPVQAWTIFSEGDSLVTVALDGSIRPYANWAALKSGTSGTVLATTSPGREPSFGANRTTIAAVWPDSTLYLLASGEARQRRVRLPSAALAELGNIHGLDLGEDGRVYIAGDNGISVFSSEDGHLITRWKTPALYGLSCQAGLAAGAVPPVLSASPRPGFYAPATTEYIVTSSDCPTPFNGPRYVAQEGGPELLVIGNYFTEPSTIRDERSTPHILALTSIQSTHWNIVVTPSSGLERIVLNGAASTISVQSARTIPTDNFFDATKLGDHSGSWPSLDDARLRAALERQTSRPVTELFGCHHGANYLVRDIAPLCAGDPLSGL